MPPQPGPISDIRGARVLAVLADSITTDHISPAGSTRKTSPAGQYLISHGVQPADFNSYGARRGNHEVMVRGTFANVRLKNKLAPETEGPFTVHLPDGAPMSRPPVDTSRPPTVTFRSTQPPTPPTLMLYKPGG